MSESVLVVGVKNGFTALTTAVKALTGRVTALEALGIPIQPEQTSGFYTFVLADANTCTPSNVAFGSASFIISLDSTTNFDVGTVLYIKQQPSSARASFEASGGVTFNVIGVNTTTGPNTWMRAIKVASNTWDVSPFVASRYDVLGTYVEVGGVLTLDLSSSDYLSYTMWKDISSIVPSPGSFSPNAGYVRTFSVRFKQAASGTLFHLATGSAFHPVAGSDTDIVQTLGAYSMLVATTFDGGARWEYVMRACGA